MPISRRFQGRKEGEKQPVHHPGSEFDTDQRSHFLARFIELESIYCPVPAFIAHVRQKA